jgi:hypothetical protein
MDVRFKRTNFQGEIVFDGEQGWTKDFQSIY